jgi:Polysaccharide deacetylase
MFSSENKQNAIITFDYEVFLGREIGTIENSVIKPTSSILKILKENNAKSIFFVDTTWLLFLKENFSEDFQTVSDQLKNIVKSGSSVELHLHPQWINATVTGKRIRFDSLAHYKLHSLNESEIFHLFSRSIDLLQSITNQKVQCFRAGGWCIEPFSKIKNAFETYGIKYDFSALPGISLKEGKEYDFDFSKAPELPFYKFANSVNEPVKEGSFIEFPLSTYKNNPGYRVLNKILLKIKRDSIFGDGVGSKEKSIFRTLIQATKFSKEKLNLDRTSNTLFKYLLKTHFRRSSLIVIISHPKIVSNQSLLNLLYISRNFVTLNSEDLNRFIK